MSKAWRLYVCGCRGSMPMHGDEYNEFGGATSCYILKKGNLCTGTGLRKRILQSEGDTEGLREGRYLADPSALRSPDGNTELRRYTEGGGGPFLRNLRPLVPGEYHKGIFQGAFLARGAEIGPCVQVDSPGERRLREDLLVRSYPSPHPNGASILRVEAGDKVLCIMFDYEHTGTPPEGFLEGCSLLAFDGMYTEEEYEAHRGWGHSCYLDGCAYAKEYQIPRLYITHHEPGKTDAELRVLEQKAQKIYPGTRFARMGDVIEL